MEILCEWYEPKIQLPTYNFKQIKANLFILEVFILN